MDNATNRSLGRVGMPLGSCVHSSSSSSGGARGSSASGYMGGSSSSSRSTASTSSASSAQRCYVDNASNQSLGRVGKAVGTHVVHKDGSTTVSGSVGTSYGATSSSTKTHVDNKMNRKLGRVGKPHGTHVVHKDGTTTVSGSVDTSYDATSSSPKTHVDNKMNRKLGRVGKPHGTHVVHKDGSVSVSSPKESTTSSKGFYVDNEVNRKLGRVGMPKGTHVVHKDGGVTITHDIPSSSVSAAQRFYVDNPFNRRLVRVGKPIHNCRIGKKTSIESSLVQKLLCEQSFEDIVQILRELDFADQDYPAVRKAQVELQRTEVEESWKKSGIDPSTDYSKADEMTKEIIPLAEISVQEKIGEGGFGKVYAALWKDTPIAFKKLAYQQIRKKKREQFVKEIRIFSKLSHDNIVKMFGVVVDAENIGIIMEYLPKTLYHAIFIEEVLFGREEKKRIIGEIIAALCYLHTPEDTLSYSKPKIAHCDVKGQNILLDFNNVAKLCDFGLSAMKNNMQSSSSRSLAVPGQGHPSLCSTRGPSWRSPHYVRPHDVRYLFSLSGCI